MNQLVMGGWGRQNAVCLFLCEAAVCFIIEPGCAKLNGVVGRPNPCAVANSELEPAAGPLAPAQAELLGTCAWKPSSSLTEAHLRQFAFSHPQKSPVWLRMAVLDVVHGPISPPQNSNTWSEFQPQESFR